MAERHRQESPRLENEEIENVFGLSFVELLDWSPAPVLLILYRTAGGRTGEISLKQANPRQMEYWKSYVADQWLNRRTLRPVLCKRILENEGKIQRILDMR